MSRIELHCPSCGYDVPMTLLPPPKMFECPECQEVMPRDKLTRLKVLHRHIAGAPASTAMFAVGPLGSGNFFDAAAATASLTITNCVFQAGDIAIVCVGGFLSGSGGTAATSITIGGLAALSSGNALQDVIGEIWSRANITSGSKSVVVNWTVNVTAAAVVVLALRRGRTATGADGTTPGAGSGSGPNYDTGATSALLVAGELVVANVAFGDTDGVAAATFPSGYSPIGRAGTHGGAPGDVTIDVAWKLALSSDPVQVVGTVATTNQVSAFAATFRPA